jgi:hypothetical protein
MRAEHLEALQGKDTGGATRSEKQRIDDFISIGSITGSMRLASQFSTMLVAQPGQA